MSTTHTDTKREILTKQIEDAATTRARIAERMEGYGAVLWTPSVFGSTGLPVLTVSDTERHDVYGLRLERDGMISAIIAPVPMEHVQEAMALSQAQAERHITPGITIVSGTTAEWDVLLACLEATLPLIHAEKKEDRPLPWW